MYQKNYWRDIDELNGNDLIYNYSQIPENLLEDLYADVDVSEDEKD